MRCVVFTYYSMKTIPYSEICMDLMASSFQDGGNFLTTHNLIWHGIFHLKSPTHSVLHHNVNIR